MGLARTADPSDVRDAPVAAGSRLEDAALADTRGSNADTALDETISSDGDDEGERQSFQTVSRDHYAVGEELARGGMGRISSARDRRLGRPVAIKELLRGSSSAKARFEREALITASLQHPAIVPLYEAGHWPDGEPFFAMKLVAGAPLDLVVRKCKSSEERIGLLHRVIDVADALAYAHSRDVIHRDLKPANVLVGDFGETVVIDWGLAKRLGEEEQAEDESDVRDSRSDSSEGLTVLGQAIGTPAYMAPEQARGEEVDKRADVYSLGAMLYHVLCGDMAYAESKSADDVLSKVLRGPPAPLETLVDGLPAELLTIVKKAMAREADDRYQDAADFADELRRFQSGQLVAAHSYSLSAHLIRWVRTHKTVVTSLSLALVVASIAAVWSIRSITVERDKAMVAERMAGREMKLALEQEALAERHSLELALNLASGTARDRPLEALELLVNLDGLEASPELVARARSIAAQARSNGIPDELTTSGTAQGAIALSPDDRQVAIAWNESEVTLINLEDKSRRRLEGSTTWDRVESVRFSPDGKYLAATGDRSDDHLALWNLDSGTFFSFAEGGNGDLSFSPDGRWLVSYRNSRSYVYDLAQAPAIQPKRLPIYRVRAVDFSPDSKTMAIASTSAMLYNLETEEIRSILFAGPANEHGGRIDAFHEIRFSQDGSQLAFADDRLFLADVASGEFRELFHSTQDFSSLAFSPDNKMLAAASEDQIIYLYPAKEKKGILSILTGHESEIDWLTFADDSRNLISSASGGQLRHWSLNWVNRGNLLISRSVEVLSRNLGARIPLLSSDASRIVVFDRTGKLQVRDRKRPDAQLLAEKSTWMRSLLAVGDRQMAWSGGGQDQRVQVADIHGESRVLGSHGEQIDVLAISPDDRYAVSGGAKMLKLWDIKEGTMSELVGHPSLIRFASFVGTKLFSADLEGYVFVWELPGGEGKQVAEHGQKLNGMVGVAVDPKGRWIATGGIRRKVFLHSLEDGSKHLLGEGEIPVRGIAVDAEGDRLAMSMKRSEVTVFDAASGEEVAVLKSPAPREELVFPSFSEDGKSLVVSNDLTGLRLWRDWESSGESVFLRAQGSSWFPEFSDDGMRVIAPSDPDGATSIWQVETRERRDLPGRDVTGKAYFWPAAQRIAVSSRDGYVTLWLDDLPEEWAALRTWIREQIKEHRFAEVR